ncbi:Male sterility, NAD-binding [Colletotrichum scovillei]|uniref:Male sterility, NAD-binding n=1 Tax=Colletotrichum scovillei TaxID=1209932 RepID=UPI0015C38F7B|nr:Male sterility, NAD-binding [Colletotrichum scovillei]KAF4772823.1 Male sterility, NAD-binding [Colletotrichum scovillei]
MEPLRVCIVSSTTTLDFRTLWAQVATNAERFRGHGVLKGSRIVIVSQSSPAAIVALLAVLSAGAIGVPLSSSLPVSRIQSIAQLGGITHLIDLTEPSKQISLPDVTRLTLDLCVQGTASQPVPNLFPEQDAKSPAVVIYTSGSTGEPKGVVHSHASLSTMAFAVGNALRLGPAERNLLFPSFGWASHGLEDTITRFAATRTTLPSSVLGIMGVTAVPSLTGLVLAGEPMRPDLVDSWSSRLKIYWNYGSSETLMVLVGSVNEGDMMNSGHALQCCRCYLVDDGGLPVLPGKAGQLVVESYTNFMGYLREGKVHPSERSSGCCPIVRSGDLFLQDIRNATFTHKGRLDCQLKISGQRFEPQEVENKLLSALENVKELAVTVAILKENSSRPALVVLVVLEQPSATKKASLTLSESSFTNLVQTLPSYMIPVGGLSVGKLPRLPNGKLDRRSLVSLAEQRTLAELIDMRPTTDCQLQEYDVAVADKIALVWANVLGLEVAAIKPTSSFLLLGGNSLSALRVCKELRAAGIMSSISDFFLHPTLKAIVQLVAERSTPQSDKARGPPLRNQFVADVNADELLSMASEQCGVSEKLIEEVFPCTPMQAALMTLGEVQDGAYIAEHAFRLPRTWAKTDFLRAWNVVLRNTPMLRSRIVRHQNGRLYNVTMLFDEGCALPLESFSRQTPMTCGSQLFQHCIHDALGDEAGSIWRWRIHHSVYDRWSTHLILEMTQKAYRDQRIPSPTPFSTFSYAVVNEQSSEGAKEFWRSRLESFTGSVFPQLPLDRFICRASSCITVECNIQHRSSAVTQATFIQATLALMISKVHGESDVVFGMTVHGRGMSSDLDLETVVGPTITSVPMRIHVDPQLQVRKFLELVQTQVALTSDHEHYSLQNIKSLGPGSASAASFTTLLIIQPDFESRFSRDAEAVVEIENGSSDSYVDYPLVVECFPRSGGVTVKMLYDPAVLPGWDVEMMAKQFEQLLLQIESSIDPATVVSDLRPLTHQQAADILKFSCGDLAEYQECLQERIFAKARDWGTNDAVQGWDARYTYSELQSTVKLLSPRVSSHLGGTTDARIIPICYEKSAAAVVAMLTTLSAGYGFLMIDSGLPTDRIKYMLEAIGANCVVCSNATQGLVLDIGARPINFEGMFHDKSSRAVCSSDAAMCSPESPAYCIFTSGSTGYPKGVVLLHKQVTSGLEAQCSVGLYPRGARLLQFSSYSFDTSIADIFATLLSGGCVCIPRDESKLLQLAKNINEFSANVIDLTPSVARMIQPADVPKLEVLRLGGESMHQHHIETWAKRCNLQNTYGPTECCVQCTFVDHIDNSTPSSVIGKGIGCHTWVVDPQTHDHLMPLGAVGELAIQGPAVASGYINNNTKSKDSFLPKAPWLATYNVECAFPTYLTGDLVKFNEQGNLIFVGRGDNQIKIRGQRVELEEIENNLQQHALTKQAIVSYPAKGPLASQLVAILEPSYMRPSKSSSPPGPAIDLQQIHKRTKEWMKESAQQAANFLPHHMVPSVYLRADRVLLSASGKLDRRSIQQWLEQISADKLESLQTYRRASGSCGPSKSPLYEIPKSVMLPIIEQIRYLLSWRSGDEDVQFSARHTFSQIGLDSITIVPLLKWLNKTHELCMDMQTLLRLETTYDLACYLHQGRNAQKRGDSVDIDGKFQDIVTKGVNRLCNSNPEQRPQRVLLTGGTSLSGLTILLRLLDQYSSVNVTVMMRCDDAATGKKRLVEKAQLLGSWKPIFSDRIEIWPGDLTQDRLGLSQSHWDQLGGYGDPSKYFDSIIHNAAAVDWFGGFQALRKVNVDAALDLVERAKDSPATRRIVYISGGPQWDPEELAETTISEGGVLEDVLARSNAYGQTKLITGAIIQRAAASNPRLAAKFAVVRPALIIGSSVDGVPNLDDFVWRVVMGCQTIRAFPEEPMENWVYLCGADRFADIVIDKLDSSTGGEVCETRVENGLSVGRFWEVINQVLSDTVLEPLDYGAWLRRLKKDMNASTHDVSLTESHPCQPIMHILESTSEILGAATPRFDNQELRSRMEDETAWVLQKNVKYLADIGCFSDAAVSWSAKAFTRSKVRTRLARSLPESN